METITSSAELEARLKKFALRVLRLVKSLPNIEENRIYGRQVIRSSSSIGANYAEATCAHTRLDFLHDINKCRKEAKETVYWLELISEANPLLKEKMTDLLDESRQIYKIFMSSVKTAKKNQMSSLVK